MMVSSDAWLPSTSTSSSSVPGISAAAVGAGGYKPRGVTAGWTPCGCPWERLRDMAARARAATAFEVRHFRACAPYLAAGLAMQYVHGVFTKLAFRRHVPAAPLDDLGFRILPEMGPDLFWVSETVFTVLFLLFLSFLAAPLAATVLAGASAALPAQAPLLFEPRRSALVVATRALVVASAAQVLRVISFTLTSLPSPAVHCRLDPEGNLPPGYDPPRTWKDVVWNDIPNVSKGCGDLLFSSHTTFALVFALSITRYAPRRSRGYRYLKAVAWALVAVLCILIVASRKHYTSDVVVALYVVPLLYYGYDVVWVLSLGARHRSQWAHVTSVSPTPSAAECDNDDESAAENAVVLQIDQIGPHASAVLHDAMFGGGNLLFARCTSRASEVGAAAAGRLPV